MALFSSFAKPLVGLSGVLYWLAPGAGGALFGLVVAIWVLWICRDVRVSYSARRARRKSVP